MLENKRTLVLNADFTPISLMPLHHIRAEDAIVRVVNGTSFVVDTYDEVIKTPNPKNRFAIPSVIARVEFLNRNIIMGPRAENLFYRDLGKCGYCRRELKLYPRSPVEADAFTIDHVLPRSKGGKHEWNNIVSSCTICNARKGDKLAKGEWVPKIRVYTPTYYELVHNRKQFPIRIKHESWLDWIGGWDAEVYID